MPEHSIIARRLREARQRARMTQAALGMGAGLEQSVAGPRVNQYEQGKHTPDWMLVERFATVLSVPAPYFYAQQDQLAAWILAFDRASPTARAAFLDSLQSLSILPPERPPD